MNRALPLIALAAAALLAACGGGKPGSEAPVVTLGGRAVDGPLQGAFACYDTNDNHACDAGEPRSAATAADGSFALAVPRAAAGRHAMVVEVPAEAIDADTGAPVGQAFVMRAPATGADGAHHVFVSPLTTLVHAQVVHGGIALSQAVQFVREQAGLGSYSPLADFTQDGSEAARHGARVARLAQLTALAQLQALRALVGTPDRNGAAITAAAVEREVQMGLLALLPAVAGAAVEPALLDAGAAQLQPLLQERAQALAEQAGLTPEVVRAMATLQRLAEPPLPNPAVATAVLRVLRYVDADNWSYRYNSSSAADATPDANNRQRYHDVRVASAAPNAASAPLPGIARAWAGSIQQNRSTDLHWNGSAWVGCQLTDRFETTVRDALGRNSSDYCNGRESSSSQRRLEDVSGQSIAQVVAGKIRTFPGGSSGTSFASWGPDDFGLYGSATFPTGALLDYRTTLALSTAPAYDVATTNQVALFSAAVASGGDFRADTSLACGDPAQNTLTTPAVTLEDVINRARGQPCIFNQGGVTPNLSLVPNEAWGFSTIGVGDLANALSPPGGTGSFYTATARIRVAFSGSNRVLFHRCYVQTSNGSTRNCSLIGLGTWSIQTLGDARVLSYTTAPTLAQRLGYAQVLVERGGRVYYGYKSPAGGVTAEVRLNMIAANAVLEQLGLPRIRPVTQPGTATGARAANLATLQGAWGSNDATSATVFRFGPDGRFFMAEGKAALANPREQSGTELGWFDHDPTTGAVSTLLELDSNLSSGTSHPQAGDPPLLITPTALSVGTTTLNRLGNDAGGLVGMWAVTSATDLSVPHLVFYANGRVLFVDHSGGDTAQCTVTGEGPPGAEYASWSYDAGRGEVTISGKIRDSNGCAGLFDSSAQSIAFGTDNIPVVFPVSFAPDRLTMQLGGPRGSNETWFRIPVQ